MDVVCDKLLEAFGAMEEKVLQVVRSDIPRAGAPGTASWSLESPWVVDTARKQSEENVVDSQNSALDGTFSSSGRIVGKSVSLMHIDLQSAETMPELREDQMLPWGIRTFCIKVVNHPMFHGVVCTFIGLSVLASVLEEEYAGYQANVSLGLADPGAWQGADTCFSILRHVFNVVFLLEVVMCISVKGLVYLKDPWGCFDAVLVTANCIDMYILENLSTDSGPDFTVIRVARVFRIVRSFKVAKKVKIMQPLHLFMRTITGSIGITLWSLVFLGLVQLMGALFVSRFVHSFIVDPSQPLEDRLWANRMYGSAMKSYYTFFEITFSGGWPNYVRPLIEKVGVGYAAFFAVYIAGWVFAALRIVSALFIKETLAQASKDEESHATQKREEKRRIVRRFRRYFAQADTSHNGQVDADEFLKLFRDPEVRNWLDVHEIDGNDPQAVWQLMDTGREDINIKEFVDGLLRMRGPAKAQDVLAVKKHLVGLSGWCMRVDEKLEGLLQASPRKCGAKKPNERAVPVVAPVMAPGGVQPGMPRVQ